MESGHRAFYPVVMESIIFTKLNHGWNSEPNAPDERVVVDGDGVELSFLLNPWAFDADKGAVGRLLFKGCTGWRLGPAYDEGWY